MATARMLGTPVWHTPTCRNFRTATLYAFAAVGLGAVIYLIETFALASQRRFVENPADVMMRAVGLAHFWVGWLFLFTSPRLRSLRSSANLAFWTAAGAGLCCLSYASGGTKNPFFLMAFYAYFLIHEVRDEANLFLANGDGPDEPRRAAFLNRLGASVTLTMMTLLVVAYTFHGRVAAKLEEAVGAADEVLLVLVAGVALGCVLSWWQTLRFASRNHIAWHGYAPLLAVYASIGALLTLGSLLGSIGFNLIVLVHVAAWLVFTHERLARQASPPRGVWAWLRSTPAGLLTLHAVAALIVLVLMALRVHLWERSGWVSSAFATSSFPYWSIMHITMAFWRGR